MKRKIPGRKHSKNSKRNAAVISAVLSVIFVAVIWLTSSDKPMDGLENTLGKQSSETITDTGFSITYIDVGQGDSALIRCDGKTMLIDAGENGSEDNIFDVFDSYGITKLDYAVASHPHSDHIGGMKEVIEKYSPDSLIMPELSEELTPDTYVYTDMITAAKENGTEMVYPSVGDTYSVGSASVVVMGPTDDYTDELNDMSLVLMVYYGDTSYLFTGDMEEQEEQDILDSPAVLDCDVLKVAHHGSSASSCEEFLKAASPEFCIISVGADNAYGHPNESTLERLGAVTEKIYRTDILGNITVTSDGKKISVTTSA